MHPSVMTAFMISLGLGTTITFASSHWFLAWMGVEINTLALVPLIAGPQHPRALECATKYLVIQAIGGAMLLFAAATNAWLVGHWDLARPHNITASIVAVALALKIGLAPFHFWLPGVLQGLDLPTAMILSTWQKIAPFTLLAMTMPCYHNTYVALGLASIVVGGYGGLVQTQIRKLLAYSSIAHLGWMCLVFPFSAHLAAYVLAVYACLTTCVFVTMKFTKAKHIKALATAASETPALAAITPIILMSLGGLPPLTGFAPKWAALQTLIKEDLLLVSVITIVFGLLGLFMYFRYCYGMSFISSPNFLQYASPWRKMVKRYTLPLACLTSIGILLLPITPMVRVIVTLF